MVTTPGNLKHLHPPKLITGNNSKKPFMDIPLPHIMMEHQLYYWIFVLNGASNCHTGTQMYSNSTIHASTCNIKWSWGFGDKFAFYSLIFWGLLSNVMIIVKMQMICFEWCKVNKEISITSYWLQILNEENVTKHVSKIQSTQDCLQHFWWKSLI